MLWRPLSRRWRSAQLGVSALLLLAGCALGPGQASAADVTVDATYSASLGGFTIAGGTLQFVISGNSYHADINARVTGIASLIANRAATASASGRFDAARISPQSYALAITGGMVANEVAVGFANNNVTRISATELRLSSASNRVPLLPIHKQGVVDPLGAFVIPAGTGKDPLAPAVCNRTQKIFDGRVRYDLHLVYGAREDVKGEPGSYSGPSITCAVAYRPIAGHRILSPEQQRFESNIEFSIRFVPVAQTGLLLPHRIVIQTQSGLLVVNATQLVVRGSEPIVADASAVKVSDAADTPRKPHRRRRKADAEPEAPVDNH